MAQHDKDWSPRKVVVVGAGAVGATFVYALMNDGAANEIALIDVNGAKTPAFYTYKLMTSKLGGISALAAKPAPDGLAVYEATVDGRSVYVVWSNAGERTFSIPVPWPRATVTRIITRRGVTRPQTEHVEADGGRVTLRVSCPLFLEAADEDG